MLKYYHFFSTFTPFSFQHRFQTIYLSDEHRGDLGLLYPEYAQEQRICIQPRPSQAYRKGRLKKGKGFFASLSKQRTGL